MQSAEKTSVYTITNSYITLGYFAHGFIDKIEFAQRVKEEYEEIICELEVNYCYLRKVPHYELGTIIIKANSAGKGAFKATLYFPGGNI
jgi:hypothetical protein